MNKNKLKVFTKTIDSLNAKQSGYMRTFVSQANERAVADIKFEWEDKSLIDYVNLKFEEVKIFLKDHTKKEDETNVLIKPLNNLIKQFNDRSIDYYEFISKYKELESNLIQASKSEKYSINYDNFESHYSQSSMSTILGVGGMGKSHFLWECQCVIQEEKLYKSLFLYGKFFNDVKSVPWDAIGEYATQKEFLLVIDGINEIIDLDKRVLIYNKIMKLSQSKYMRIFVSYRTYSLTGTIDGIEEEEFLSNLMNNRINFSGVDFDSSIAEIVSSFKVDISYYYNILYSNNPMHIRMLVESDILNSQKLYNDLRNRSVVSITFIYERFVKTACKRLWKEKEQSYWVAIKNLCRVLYNSNRSFFVKSDICSRNINVEKFINDLKNGGYIITYDGIEYYFAWEQLSNYLIARTFNEEIKNKSDDEICYIYKKKSREFPRITQFLISVLVEKYHKDFYKFIEFISRVKPQLTDETLLNVTIRNIEDRHRLQKCIQDYDVVQLISDFGGIPNRVFNCESFIFDYLCSENVGIIKPNLFFRKSDIIRKLKCNLYNLNGKYFLQENAQEYFRYAVICLLIPDDSIIQLSEKTILDLIEQKTNDFSDIIKFALEHCNSPLLQRSIFNVVSHLSSDKRSKYNNIFNIIENDRNFLNAKVISNYCKQIKINPFEYVRFKKKNLFKLYFRKILKIKPDFDEYESMKGLINIMRFDKLFLSLNLESYNNVKLNFRLIDIDKKKILKFNRKANKFARRYNESCNCNVDIWDNMFCDIYNNIGEFTDFSLVNQEDLFFGFVAHLEATLIFYHIDDDDIKWYKENRYSRHKIYPDNITTILRVCVEEYIGSLMCNYFQEDCSVSYCNHKIYLGYEPIKYDENQIRICSPLQSYSSVIDRLDNAVIDRLNDNKCLKDSKWADDLRLSQKNIRNILKPYLIDGIEWVMLSCDINNRTHYGRGRDFSEESILIHCATNHNLNRKRVLDRYMTIEIPTYECSIFDYRRTNTDFCNAINPIKDDTQEFKNTMLVFPPASIIALLKLEFDLTKSAWIDECGNEIIVCNNNIYQNYVDNIGGTVYIKKEYFDKIKNKLGLFYYCFTEKMSHDVGHYSNKSDVHSIFKNNRFLKICKNNGPRDKCIDKLYAKCYNCPIYIAHLNYR